MLEMRSENICGALDGLVADLKSRESVSGIGLFGSRSRGDAVPSSDVDLLIVDKRDFNYEYVERAEIEGFFLDLDFIPEKWIHRMVPPEVDQKLYELEVLYERDATLTKAKDLMLKTYLTPERAEIRTSSYLMEADTYLSRGLSAYYKNDYQSAKVNAAVGLEAVMKILIEVNKLPISNSHFIRALESSTKKFGAHNLYNDYVEISGFSKQDKQRTENMMDSFVALWRAALSFTEANSSAVKTLHIRILNDLNYYGKEGFMKGMLVRAGSLIKDNFLVEAAHYMFHASVSMLENYAWLLSALERTRFDYTSLFQYLKGSKKSPNEIYQKTVEAFGIEEASSLDAEESLRRTKEIILGIRQKRKELIMSLIS
jgi:predicted nucleotidyltransferase